jgi:hypothetical protein
MKFNLSHYWAKTATLVKTLLSRCECAGCELRRKALKEHRDKGGKGH